MGNPLDKTKHLEKYFQLAIILGILLVLVAMVSVALFIYFNFGKNYG